MELKIEKLKHSRIKFIITANSKDLAHAAEHAFNHTAALATVKGFRSGKAPAPLLVQTVGKGRILSELVDHVVPELLQQVSEENKIALIEAPAYTLEKLCELNDDGTVKADSFLKFSAEADYAPEVKVGDYTKIKIKPVDVVSVTDKMIDSVVEELADARATWESVKRPSKKGDRVEIDFTGKRNGIAEDRLASKNYPAIIGSNIMIPGFEDELIAKKTGDKFSFEIVFPKDYHAKDLAGEKVVFDILIHSVAEKKLPKIDDEFAKQFKNKSLAELKQSIRLEREADEIRKAKEANESATLDEFLPLIDLELPQSLIEREIDRQIETLTRQSQMYGLSFDDYLKHIKKTAPELRVEMRPNAEKAVKIGLGLGEVVEREGIDKGKNAGYAAIERLVAIATKQHTSRPVKQDK